MQTSFPRPTPKPEPRSVLSGRNVALASWLPLLFAAILGYWGGESLAKFVAPFWSVGIGMQISSVLLRRQERKRNREEKQKNRDYLEPPAQLGI